MSTPASPIARLKTALRRAAWIRRGLLAMLRSRSGVGAVEFALIAPMLLLLYLGGTEVSIAVSINRKVAHTSGMIGDLVTQKQTLSEEELRGIFQAGKSLIAPYGASTLKIRVSSVFINGAGTATINWSCPSTGMTKLAAGAAYSLPSSFSTLRNRYLIVSETVFPYTPVTDTTFGGAIEMGSTNYLTPRVGDNVTSSGCTSIAL